MSFLTLIPAYGRDYRSSAAVLTDWEKNMDFVVADFGNRWDGKPVNREQLRGQAVCIRYAGLRRNVLIDESGLPMPRRRP